MMKKFEVEIRYRDLTLSEFYPIEAKTKFEAMKIAYNNLINNHNISELEDNKFNSKILQKFLINHSVSVDEVKTNGSK